MPKPAPSLTKLEAAAWLLEALEDQSSGFQRWLRQVSANFNWDWAHIQYVRQHLDKVSTGEIKRLIIEMPPRHGKSELATIRYPVYRLKLKPETRIIVGAYSQTLAEKFSRKARRVAANGKLELSKERNSAEDWETVQGGGFRAVGVGGGVTGQGGDLIIVDDPVKNREEAESLTYRDKVWDWFTNDLYTRLEPGGAIIVIMTRWHKDDLVGRILESETGGQWTRLRLPAEAEPDDPIGRSEGAALCPDRFPLSVLADIRKVLGRDYNALYQQRPQPREGGMFKDHWFKRVEAVPAEARRVRWWDMGATADAGDPTVGFLLAEAQGVYYFEDVVRGQWSSGERDKIIRQTAENDRLKYGDVVIWAGQEPGSAGKDAAGNFVKMLAGYNAHTEPETGPKEVRAQPLAAQAEAGNVHVLKSDWTATLIDEFCDFPSGKNDDQVDSGSHAFNKLALGLTVTTVANTLFD